MTFLEDRVSRHFHDSAHLKLSALDALRPGVLAASEAMAGAIGGGNKILVCGNGGSAADSQHFASEFLNRLEMERGELAAIALTTDTSTLTSIANDYSFEEIFSKQVRALGKSGDILLAITTSGNSKNILKAVEVAHARGIRVVALTGRQGGALAPQLSSTDIHICVPHDRTVRIQEVHILVIHCLCDIVDTILFGEK